MWKITLCVCAVVCTSQAYRSRVAYISQGPVRGYKDAGSGMYAFYGIPYARVPTGTDRFKAPLPPPAWMDPLEAVIQNIACPQMDLYFKDSFKYKRQEECLIANVFVPDIEEDNLPVVVNVHGGGFLFTSAARVPLSKLISENNVLVVTVNYRLGIPGFLCLGTEDIPGNAGMKDLVAALKWVKNNIASFGGNPDDVTIRGSGSGSAAVDLLMLSKSAEGLFTKVIPESAANIAPGTIQSDPLETAKRLARDLNFTNVDNIYELEHFFKTASLEQLFSPASYFFDTNSKFVLSPCIERSTGADVFLDRSPVDILKSGDYRKVPILYGFSKMEGSIYLDMFDDWKDQMNEKFSDFLPADLKFVSDEQKEEVAKRVKEFYFGKKPVRKNTILSYVDYFTDTNHAYPMLRSVKFHVDAGHNQVYLYEYSYVDDDSNIIPYTNVRGAIHAEQTMAVTGVFPGYRDDYTTKEFLKHSSTMRIIWNNFIRTGKPVGDASVPARPAAGPGRAPHVSLGNEFALRGPLLERCVQFWDDIYAEHYRDPIPPPPHPEKYRTEL